MSELITVSKDGENLDVHPTALANHEKLGWVVADEKPVEGKAAEKINGEFVEPTGPAYSEADARAQKKKK